MQQARFEEFLERGGAGFKKNEKSKLIFWAIKTLILPNFLRSRQIFEKRPKKGASRAPPSKLV